MICSLKNDSALIYENSKSTLISRAVEAIKNPETCFFNYFWIFYCAGKPGKDGCKMDRCSFLNISCVHQNEKVFTYLFVSISRRSLLFFRIMCIVGLMGIDWKHNIDIVNGDDGNVSDVNDDDGNAAEWSLRL